MSPPPPAGVVMDGIMISDEELHSCKLVKLNHDGSRQWYNRKNGGWELDETDPAPATANHTHSNYASKDHIHSKVSVKFKTDEGVMVFENGILTEVVK